MAAPIARVSEALIRREREDGERRLAQARVAVMATAFLALLAFLPFAEGADRVVQERAAGLLLAGTGWAWGWQAYLRRRGFWERAPYVSSSVDTLLVALVVLNWTVYPGGQLLPTQLKFGVGYGMFFVVILLTGVRMDYRASLLATLESLLAYGALVLLFALLGGVRFVADTARSYDLHTLNGVDLAGRWLAMAVGGGLVTLVAYRGERLAVRAVETTEQRARLRQFVSANVAEAIETGAASLDLSGHRRRVTILFSDVRGFTALSEKMEAEQLLDLLNGYYQQVSREIFAQGGTLDKYVGDGVMAIFGAPGALPNSSLAATRCALGMLQRAEEYGRALGRPFPIGVGVHTAEVVVGNLGTESYKNYTAIGRGVNLAAHRVGDGARRGHPALLRRGPGGARGRPPRPQGRRLRAQGHRRADPALHRRPRARLAARRCAEGAGKLNALRAGKALSQGLVQAAGDPRRRRATAPGRSTRSRPGSRCWRRRR